VQKFPQQLDSALVDRGEALNLLCRDRSGNRWKPKQGVDCLSQEAAAAGCYRY
jgi:hypothetical protein